TQLIAEGAKWMYSIKELSQRSDVLITMVGTPEDVEAVYFGSDGLIENAKQHAYLIDMTTSKPSLAKNMYDIARINNVHKLDSPIFCGVIAAINYSISNNN